MKNYIQPGNTITLTTPYAVASGDGLLVDALFAVAAGDAAAGEPIEAVTTGVFDLAKPTGQGWSPGQPVHWDDTAQACTTVAAGNTPIGAALAAAASGDATGRVRLDGAADTRRVFLQARLPDVSTAQTVHIVSPVAGRIDSWWSTLQAAITVADAGLSLTINGTPVTGSEITIAQAGSAGGDVDTAAPTGANIVAVGDVIGIVTDGASTTAAAAECLLAVTL